MRNKKQTMNKTECEERTNKILNDKTYRLMYSEYIELSEYKKDDIKIINSKKDRLYNRLMLDDIFFDAYMAKSKRLNRFVMNNFVEYEVTNRDQIGWNKNIAMYYDTDSEDREFCPILCPHPNLDGWCNDRTGAYARAKMYGKLHPYEFDICVFNGYTQGVRYLYDAGIKCSKNVMYFASVNDNYDMFNFLMEHTPWK